MSINDIISAELLDISKPLNNFAPELFGLIVVGSICFYIIYIVYKKWIKES